MNESPTLVEKKKRVSMKLMAYRSLPEYILDGVGAALQRMFSPAKARMRASFLPFDPASQEDEDFPSYWLNGVVIALFTLLIGWLISTIQGISLSRDETYLILWSAGTGSLSLIANKVNIRAFLKTFRESLLDKMTRDNDMQNFGNWMEENFGLRKPLVSGMVAGPLLAWFLYSSWLENHHAAVFQVSVFVVLLLSSIQSVWVAYYLLPFYIAFPSRLNRYQFDLYTPDPSSSEVVGRLSRLLTFILYVTLGFIIQLTVGLTLLGVLTEQTPVAGFVFSIFVWAPTVILYAAGQFHLSDLIARAKWRMLNEVQTKIEALYSEEGIPSKDNLERLAKLMDYHDRIKTTPNSALNFRSSLNFLNSLLLPVLAFVIANLDKVLALIGNLTSNKP
jgi:hypothetical protein